MRVAPSEQYAASDAERNTSRCGWQSYGRSLFAIEGFGEGIRIIETFRPDMLRVRLGQRPQGDLPAWMRTGYPGSASDNFHRIANETVGSVGLHYSLILLAREARML